MHPMEELFHDLLSNEREKLVKACDLRLSLFEQKMQILLEDKGKCGCFAQKVGHFVKILLILSG